MSYKVFWAEDGHACASDYSDTELTEALKFCEELRKRQRDGENVSHVVMGVENSDNVTKMGVAPAPEGYMWPKRRVEYLPKVAESEVWSEP